VKYDIPDRSAEALQALKKTLGKGLEHEAVWLLESATKRGYSGNYIMNPDERLLLMQYLGRRLRGEPLQLILGNYPFRRLNLMMRQGVFIPRLETELMIDLLPKPNTLPSGMLVDACTGTGAIGISVKKEMPEFEVMLTDISSDALNLAHGNALLNKVTVSFYKMDLLEGFRQGCIGSILCNPPYIRAGEYKALSGEVRDYDPASALIAGEDGLDAIRRLVRQAKQILERNGFICFEHGYDQQDDCLSLLEGQGFRDIKRYEDLSRNPRFVSARRA